MKNIKKYNEFIKLNEEEGWKEKALAATLAASSFLGSGAKASTSDIDYNKPGVQTSYESPAADKSNVVNWPGKPKTKMKYKEVTSKEVADRLVRQKWTLDSVVVDTIWNRIDKTEPSADTMVVEIKFDNMQYFESGKYEVSEGMKGSIAEAIESVFNDNGVIFGIMVESSTDKQGLSIRLQKELISKGYDGNNKGLTKARSESIIGHLENIGVDSSIIDSKEIVESGTGDKDQSARYVTIKIVYLKKDLIEKPSVIGDLSPEIKEKYYLSKEYTPSKGKKFKIDLPKIKKHKTKKIKKPKNITDCYKF
jgi:flagellar motor protein MotB